MWENIQWVWTNFSGVIIAAGVLGASWYWGKDVVLQALTKADAFLDKVEKFIRHMKQEFKQKELYEKAEKAYWYIEKMARKTDTELDDKAAKGLEKALEYLKKAGWSPEDINDDDKDIILAHFDKLHEASKRLLKAAEDSPLAEGGPKSPAG